MQTNSTADLLPGERVLRDEKVLHEGDPLYLPANRPTVMDAIESICDKSGKYTVPFAASSLKHHSELIEQNLYRCLFGRDSLIISELLHDKKPELLKQSVLALAEHQGKKFDDDSEEEPGRIAHEVRTAEDPQRARIEAASGWRFPYYGSVDATLLWLIALERIVSTEPSFLDFKLEGLSISERAERAAGWILSRLDLGNGFIRSSRSNPKGILNQVWKDSGDSYLTSRGEVASESGTLSVETVAQTYDALLAAARLASLAEQDWQISKAELLEAARNQQEKLLNEFWHGDFFAMGLGMIAGNEQRLDAIASNQWRLLDSGILTDVDQDFAKSLIDSVTDPQILGPHGIRTLASSNPRYRPGGYHTGSSWPVDTTMIIRGLLRHGAAREAKVVVHRTIKTIERVGCYPEMFRSDDSEPAGISTRVVDVWDRDLNTENRVCQPPQLMQGWTIASYSYLKDLAHLSRD
jgi:glycogen debranching enzyme